MFAAQTIHELGHALAGALELLPLSACGASLVACVPAAFVSFPDTAVRSLPPRARSRVIAAGPFHNLVLWVALLLAVRVGLPHGIAAITGVPQRRGRRESYRRCGLRKPESLHHGACALLIVLL